MKKRSSFHIGAGVTILGAILFAAGLARSRALESAGAVLLLLGAALMTDSSSRTIALNTFREAIRHKVLYIILVFSILLIGFAAILGSISIGENDRVIKHVGLSAINLFGIFLAMFVGVNLVYEEMDRRTIYTIIAHGVPRRDFVIGKFLGLLLTIVFNFVLMGAILAGVLLITPEATLHGAIAYAIFLSLFEMMIIIAFAILFSSFSTPVVSAVLTLAVYIAGHLSDDLLAYIKILGHEAYAFYSNLTTPLLKGIYYLLPHLEEFNAKSQAADPETLQLTLFPVGYGLLYTALVLFLACVIFSRRDFR